MHERKDKWTVGEWMTENPLTVGPETSVRFAFVEMRTHGIRHLPVVSAEHTLLGIVTDRDLRRPDINDQADGWNDYYQLDDNMFVSDIMTEDVISLRTQKPIEKAVKLFAEKKIGAIPVLDNDKKVIGILSVVDAMRAFHEVLTMSGKPLREFLRRD